MFALSNLDYIQFTSDESATISAMLPEQSQIINWDDRSILVYIGPNPINVNGDLYPDVYATDVSDAPQLQSMLTPGFTAPPQSMLDALPASIEQSITQAAAAGGALLNSAGQAVTAVLATAGGAIGAGLTPVVGSLTVPLVIVGVVLALMYLPKGRQ